MIKIKIYSFFKILLLRFYHSKISFWSLLHYETKIGSYSRINRPSEIGKCKIGNFVACGGRLVVRSTDHYMCYANMQDWLQNNVLRSNLRVAGKRKSDVVIKSASWIGDSVIILPGGSVGYGAVIGAGSVVTKPIPDYAVAVGSPAKVIRYRFTGDIIAFFMRIRWWDWPIKKIRENQFLFEIDFSSVTKNNLIEIESKIV